VEAADATAVLAQLFRIHENLELVDLSHPLEELMPVWPTLSKYYHVLWLSLELGDNATAYQILMNEHTGTHADATGHFLPADDPHHRWIDQVRVDQFAGPAVVIDCRFLGPRDQVDPGVIHQWEARYGPLQPNDIVLFNFGWWKRWKPRPHDTEFLRDWPGLARPTADFLLTREVKAVGVDTPSPDAFATSGDPIHKCLLGRGVTIIENLTNLDTLPPRCFFLGFPLKIKGGSGSPIRAVALIPSTR
jgi:kynurenine formamidase